MQFNFSRRTCGADSITVTALGRIFAADEMHEVTPADVAAIIHEYQNHLVRFTYRGPFAVARLIAKTAPECARADVNDTPFLELAKLHHRAHRGDGVFDDVQTRVSDYEIPTTLRTN